jgi:hypothetical protein
MLQKRSDASVYWVGLFAFAGLLLFKFSVAIVMDCDSAFADTTAKLKIEGRCRIFAEFVAGAGTIRLLHILDWIVENVRRSGAPMIILKRHNTPKFLPRWMKLLIWQVLVLVAHEILREQPIAMLSLRPSSPNSTARNKPSCLRQPMSPTRQHSPPCKSCFPDQ